VQARIRAFRTPRPFVTIDGGQKTQPASLHHSDNVSRREISQPPVALDGDPIALSLGPVREAKKQEHGQDGRATPEVFLFWIWIQSAVHVVGIAGDAREIRTHLQISQITQSGTY
jgi:hypothetical protein